MFGHFLGCFIHFWGVIGSNFGNIFCQFWNQMLNFGTLSLYNFGTILVKFWNCWDSKKCFSLRGSILVLFLWLPHNPPPFCPPSSYSLNFSLIFAYFPHFHPFSHIFTNFHPFLPIFGHLLIVPLVDDWALYQMHYKDFNLLVLKPEAVINKE